VLFANDANAGYVAASFGASRLESSWVRINKENKHEKTHNAEMAETISAAAFRCFIFRRWTGAGFAVPADFWDLPSAVPDIYILWHSPEQIYEPSWTFACCRHHLWALGHSLLL
jgi:hypothetical protein